MQDADFVMRTDPQAFSMKGPICASGSRGFNLKTFENNCRDRAYRNLQISDGRAALRCNVSLGLMCSSQPIMTTSAHKKQAPADGAASTITSRTVANRREKTKLV